MTTWPDEPYKGLNYYSVDDKGLFAGRDDDVENVAELLGRDATRILLLQGTTGCGKSSLLRAGLIPFLQQPEHGFRFMYPGKVFVRATHEPLLQLAGAIYAVTTDNSIATRSGMTTVDLRAARQGAGSLHEFQELAGRNAAIMVTALQEISRRMPGILVVVIDQAEEMFTLAAEDEGHHRLVFFEFLRRFVATEMKMKLIIAFRTEYFGRFMAAAESWPWAHDRTPQYLLQEMTHAQLVAAIERPTDAEFVHEGQTPRSIYKFGLEPGLAARIASDLIRMAPSGGRLPVLQVACSELFRRLNREHGEGESSAIIKLDEYLKMGGLESRVKEYVARSLYGAITDLWDAADRSKLSPSDRSKLSPIDILYPRDIAETHRWRQVLYSLFRTQPDGTTTTELVAEEALQGKAKDAGCRLDFSRVMAALQQEPRRLVKSETIALRGSRSVQCYSLAHDSLGLALQASKREREVYFDRAIDVYRKAFLMILCAYAVMGTGVAAYWVGNGPMRVAILVALGILIFAVVVIGMNMAARLGGLRGAWEVAATPEERKWVDRSPWARLMMTGARRSKHEDATMRIAGLTHAIGTGTTGTGRATRKFGSWFYRNLLSVVALIAIAWTFYGVPQINQLIVQAPWFQHAGVREVLVFWAYLACLLLLFVGLCAYSLPRKDPRTDPLSNLTPLTPDLEYGFEPPAVTSPEGPAESAPPAGRLSRRCSLFAALLTVLVKRLDERVRTRLGGALIVVAIAWYFVARLGMGSRFMLEDASRTALALILGGVGMWMLLFDRGRDQASGTPHYNVAVAGRALWLMLVTYAFGEVIWFCSNGYHLLATPRAYTLWALMQFGFVAVLVARSVDAVHTYSRANVRVCVLTLVVGWAFALGPEPVGAPGPVPVKDVPAVDASWFDALEARLDSMPPGPAVIVTASGGGSRAALFAGLVYERLSSLPVSKDARTTFSDHIVLISSVSGGSLASAYQIYTPLKPAERQLPSPRNSFHDELLDRMVRKTDALLADASRPGSSDGLHKVLEQLMQDLLLEVVHDDTAAPAGAGVADDVRAVVHGRFADDMATDFMAPMLRGALLPGIERGTRLCDFWRDRFGWSGIRSSNPHEPMRPLLVLNATDSGRGVRLAVGFPPLPRGLLGETMSSLSDVAPGWEVDLAQAVRLSANFPWGLQVAVVDLGEPVQAPIEWIPPKREGYEVHHAWALGNRSKVQIFDGGLIDNTGIDTVARVFEQLQRLEDEEHAALITQASADPVIARVRQRALSVLERLRERKVLLIEIDAGKKFEGDDTLSLLFPTVFAPLSSLQVASHVNAMVRKQTYMKLLEEALSSDGTARFLSVPFVCNRDEDVMTSWTLGSKDKASVMVQFLCESRMQAEVLQNAFQDLVVETGHEVVQKKQEEIDAEAMARQERYAPWEQMQALGLRKWIKPRVNPRGLEWRTGK